METSVRIELPPASSGAPAGRVLNAAVVVAALGYFVDVYDLVLLAIVRVRSLTDLGVAGDALVTEGLAIMNWQMMGMLLGGVLFGVVADKRGRLPILFASITLYSVASVASGFVTDVGSYRVARFFTGFGLAGELGAGVTLVTELLPARLRGYGTMVIGSLGMAGAIGANLVAKAFDWRIAYWVGGGLGLLLLALRIKVHESRMFEGVRRARVSRGDFWSLFRGRDRLGRYAASILIGVPILFTNQIPVALAPEYARALGVTGPVTAGDALMVTHAGLVCGDLASGYLSNVLRSRRKVIVLFLLLLAAANGLYFLGARGFSPAAFLAVCALLGFSGGYWAVFVTVAAEQFGTNIRATVATTVPNFARGLLMAVNLMFVAARPRLGPFGAALAVAAVWFSLALASGFRLRETFGADLDYLETD